MKRVNFAEEIESSLVGTIKALLSEEMNTYAVFYNGKRAEVKAETTYAAQLSYANEHKVPAKKRHMISVKLVGKGESNEPVVHVPDF